MNDKIYLKIQPNQCRENIILQHLQTNGICVIKDFFPIHFINLLKKESLRLLDYFAHKIDILDKEDCSKDERLFDAQELSQPIKSFADTEIFKNVARSFCKSLKMKTLVNRVIFERGVVKNSGAGWHRDNHDCQFKAILYLTDVDCNNGNFQWITNSSKNHIGFPKPRTESYDTRFDDEVIDKLLENYGCNLINIVGPKGTLILADTTYIHRGNIIASGERLALTQYYF